ncbi:MAG: hypothetical protein PQJ58_14890 [Spirochaetales bacterium]|nr:hypothetical protein [Spirochaetales bacterium]
MFLSELTSLSAESVLLLLLFIAFLFYLIIPIGGAFYVRKNWRVFRTNLRRSLDLPMAVPGFTEKQGSLGLHRFLGELEAIEGDDLLWIKGSQGTITAEMKNARVYNMTDTGVQTRVYSHLYPYTLPGKSLVHMSWNDIFSLTEGTRLFLFGDLNVQNRKYCLKSSRELPLTVIIYNEDPFTLIPRAAWCGRHSNEFWNFLTPWSVLTGTLLLLIHSVWFLQYSSNYSVIFISLFLSLIPLILFLPPGVFLFNLYKYFWDRGRRFRAERDLIRLPLGFGNKAVDSETHSIAYERRPTGWKGEEKKVCYPIPEGLLQMSEQDRSGQCICFPQEPGILARYCQRRAFLYESLSGLVFAGGLILNFILFWIVVLRIL